MPASQKPEKPEPNSHVTKWCKCIGMPQALVCRQHDLHLLHPAMTPSCSSEGVIQAHVFTQVKAPSNSHSHWNPK